MIARGVSLWSIRLAWLLSLPTVVQAVEDLRAWLDAGVVDPRLSAALLGAVVVFTSISSVFDRARHRRRIGQKKVTARLVWA